MIKDCSSPREVKDYQYYVKELKSNRKSLICNSFMTILMGLFTALLVAGDIYLFYRLFKEALEYFDGTYLPKLLQWFYAIALPTLIILLPVKPILELGSGTLDMFENTLDDCESIKINKQKIKEFKNEGDET